VENGKIYRFRKEMNDEQIAILIKNPIAWSNLLPDIVTSSLVGITNKFIIVIL